MRLTASATIPRIAPAAALRWWSDFQEGPGDHAWLPGQRRIIVDRGPDGVTMEDRVLRFYVERTTARVEGSAVRFRGTNPFSHFEGAYEFVPEGDGTRIVLDADVHLKPWLAWTRRIAEPVARWIVTRDLAGHARELEREHAADPDSSRVTTRFPAPGAGENRY